MVRKILFKIICIIILTIIFIMNVSECIVVNAGDKKKADDYINIYTSDATDIADKGGNDIKKFLNRVIGVIQVIGVFISVTMLVSLGIKYMYASAGDKAQIKNHLTVYVIGAAVMFGATGILQMIKEFFLDATKG